MGDEDGAACSLGNDWDPEAVGVSVGDEDSLTVVRAKSGAVGSGGGEPCDGGGGVEA